MICERNYTNRIEYIDYYRAIGIVMMVMGHIGFGATFDKFIHAFHMPMFFFVSGFLYKRTDSKIYDLINVIPYMLSRDKYEELLSKDDELRMYYQLQENGFYKVSVSDTARDYLKEKILKLGFSAINFTDSRSIYSFYNLANLCKALNLAVSAGIELWHPAVEPVSAGELYKYLTGETFVNEIMQTPAYYDYKTIHSDTFGGSNGYIMDKESVMKDIKEFVESVVKL